MGDRPVADQYAPDQWPVWLVELDLEFGERQIDLMWDDDDAEEDPLIKARLEEIDRLRAAFLAFVPRIIDWGRK